MVKILIVDDEKIERNGIKFLLKQLNIEAETYEAVNGVKALEKMEKETFDILLTDIKMPFMDGLTLIQNVAEKYPDQKTIIFSGYGEFEYAKKAMEFDVNDYILKPVDPNEFETAIKKVIKIIEDENLAREQREEGEMFFKEHILLSLINGISYEDIQEKSGKLMSVDFIDEFHHMFLVEFEHDFFGSKGADFKKDILAENDIDCQYLNLNPQQCLLLFKEMDEKEKKNIAKSINKKVEKKYDEKCYISVSDKFEKAAQIPEIYERLENLMENKFYLLDSRVFLENSEKTNDDENAIEDDMLMKQINQDIRVKDMVGLRSHFDQLCEKYKGKKVFSQMYVKFIFSNLMKDMYEILPENENKDLSVAVDKLYRANDFSEVMAILQEGIKKLEDNFSVNPQMLHREIETVKEYIYANYDKELSVDMLAEQVYMAPSYLSHIFKKETGQNLSKFIKSLRMEKAKEMLTQTHNKIVNISYAVGYPNVSYFCQSFRKYFGVSPQKFRKEGEQDAQ